MSDPLALPDPGAGAVLASEAAAQAATDDSGGYPWDEAPPAGAADTAPGDGPRERHDGFTEARKRLFLTALVKTGCIAAAARKAGIAVRTVYRHQDSDALFSDHCAIALRMSATPIELAAWQRAVEGVEEHYVAGGQVRIRVRHSDSLLRLLLQGADPKRYGPRPGFKRKRLLKHERKQMEREIRAEIAAEQKPWTFEESIALLDKKLKALGSEEDRKKLAEGWTMTDEGHWIPPGYGPVGSPPGGATDRDGDPRDSM